VEPLVTGRRGITIRHVLLVGLVSTGLAFLVLGYWTAHGGGPLRPPPWGAFIVLVFMAVGVFFAGLPVRRFLRGKARKSLNPMRAMRTVVLAQASALTGALVTGWYVAQILVLLPDLDIASRRLLAWRLAALAVGGVLMAVAGLAVQAMCRVDHNGDDDRDSTGSRNNAGSAGLDGDEGSDGSNERR
jgi:Protein of unknown function (DUF3180)